MKLDNIQLRKHNDCSRIHRVVCREVTNDLPSFPDEYWGKLECDIPGDSDDIILDSYREGQWFYIEIHLRGWGWYGPIAHATVNVKEDQVELIGMYVIDGLREQGYGRALIESVAGRWPDVIWQGCEASRKFMDRLVEQGVAIKTAEYTGWGYSAHFKFGRSLNLPFPGNDGSIGES